MYKIKKTMALAMMESFFAFIIIIAVTFIFI